MQCQFCSYKCGNPSGIQQHLTDGCPANSTVDTDVDIPLNTGNIDTNARDNDVLNSLPCVSSGILPLVRYQVQPKEHHVNNVNHVNNSTAVTIHKSNYVLNEKRARAKKRKACDRENYKVKQNQSSTTVVFSTAAFEVFRSNVCPYLEHQSYNFKLDQSTDIPGKVTHDILRVFTTISSSECTSLYTMNLYRTTSRVVVNGPHYTQFAVNDLPQITGFITQVDRPLAVANYQLKKLLLNSNEQVPVQHQPSPSDYDDIPRKRMAKDRKFRSSGAPVVIKKYNTRSCNVLSDSSDDKQPSIVSATVKVSPKNLIDKAGRVEPSPEPSSPVHAPPCDDVPPIDKNNNGDERNSVEIEVDNEISISGILVSSVSTEGGKTDTELPPIPTETDTSVATEPLSVQLNRCEAVPIPTPMNGIDGNIPDISPEGGNTDADLKTTPIETSTKSVNESDSSVAKKSLSVQSNELEAVPVPMPIDRKDEDIPDVGSHVVSLIADNTVTPVSSEGLLTKVTVSTNKNESVLNQENISVIKEIDSNPGNDSGQTSKKSCSVVEPDIECRRSRRSTKPPPKYQDHVLDKSQKKSSPDKSIAPSQSTFHSDMLYCVCQKPWKEEEGDNMVFCENCCQWLHYSCLGIEKEKVVAAVDKFICFQCAMLLFVNAESSKYDHSSVTLTQKLEIDRLSGEIKQLNQQLSSVESDLRSEQEKSATLSKENTKLKNENTNHLSNKTKNLQLQQEVDNLKSHQETLRGTIASFKDTESAISNAKTQLEVKEKELKNSAKSLEVMTKKCAALEKDQTSNLAKISTLEQSINEGTKSREELESKIATLNKEIASHISINKDIVAQSTVDPSSQATRPKQCAGCKQKTDEIKTLKDRICTTESIIKDHEKSKVSTNTQLCAAKMELKREKAINNILMKFNESSDDPPAGATSDVNNGPLSTTNASDTVNNVITDCNEGTPLVHEDDSTIANPREVDLPDSDRTNLQLDFCEKEFDKAGSCPDKHNCSKNHDFDYHKLSKGPCIHELRRKNSCQVTVCRFSHQIPSTRRGDAQLLQNTRLKMDSQRNNVQAKSDALNSIDVCSDEFFDGPNSCKERGCRSHKDHKLDFTKVRRGICLFEFFKKGSCSRKSKCHFTHKFPLQCLSNPAVTQSVLESINQCKMKDKISEVLGQDIVDSAAALLCSESKKNQHHNPVDPKSAVTPKLNNSTLSKSLPSKADGTSGSSTNNTNDTGVTSKISSPSMMSSVHSAAHANKAPIGKSSSPINTTTSVNNTSPSNTTTSVNNTSAAVTPQLSMSHQTSRPTTLPSLTVQSNGCYSLPSGNFPSKFQPPIYPSTGNLSMPSGAPPGNNSTYQSAVYCPTTYNNTFDNHYYQQEPLSTSRNGYVIPMPGVPAPQPQNLDSYNTYSMHNDPALYSNTPPILPAPTSHPFLTNLIKELISKENQKFQQYHNPYVM